MPDPSPLATFRRNSKTPTGHYRPLPADSRTKRSIREHQYHFFEKAGAEEPPSDALIFSVERLLLTGESGPIDLETPSWRQSRNALQAGVREAMAKSDDGSAARAFVGVCILKLSGSWSAPQIGTFAVAGLGRRSFGLSYDEPDPKIRAWSHRVSTVSLFQLAIEQSLCRWKVSKRGAKRLLIILPVDWVGHFMTLKLPPDVEIVGSDLRLEPLMQARRSAVEYLRKELRAPAPKSEKHPTVLCFKSLKYRFVARVKGKDGRLLATSRSTVLVPLPTLPRAGYCLAY